jgi:hypothetical protein
MERRLTITQQILVQLSEGSRERFAYFFELAGKLATEQAIMIRRGNVNARRVADLDDRIDRALLDFEQNLSPLEAELMDPDPAEDSDPQPSEEQ